jgi:hypothetical protein
MIDEETARQGLEALAVAIAILMEDASEPATSVVRDFGGYPDLAEMLLQTGRDVTALAAAMQVLAARAEAP